MQLIIDVKESAVDKIMYFLNHLKDDVKIVQTGQTDEFMVEIVSKDEADYNYIKDAGKRRKEGEKTYSIDDILKEFG